MSDKALEIRQRTAAAEDKKVRIQLVHFVDEIHDISKKSDVAQNRHTAKIRDFTYSTQMRAKREVMSSDEDKTAEPGDPDGTFSETKDQ